MSLPSGPILVVEDDADMRQMLTTMLEVDGQRVVTATNGKDGFSQARLHHPRLIILDLMMPVMTGEEFLAAQRSDVSISRIPVLVVSASQDAPQVAERMHTAGCLAKPIDFDALCAFVKETD